MRYILNDEGYIYDVSFGAEIECSLGTCTEYKGDIPEDYETIEEWFSGESERLNAWKIVDGNLVFDASRDYKLKVIYEQQNNENSHVTRKELGMASTEEINPYANLFPSKSSGSGRIVRLEDWYNKVGNLPIEKIELMNWSGDSNLDFIELEFIGGNFLPNTAISNTNNGIEYIQNQDKTISIKGTATAKSTLNLAGTDTSIKKILTFKGNYDAYDGEGNPKIFKQFYNLWGLAEGINLEFYYFDGTDRTLVGTYSEGLIQYDEDTHVTQVVLTVDEGTTIDTTITPMLTIMGFTHPILPMTKYKGNLFDIDNSTFAYMTKNSDGSFTANIQNGYYATFFGNETLRQLFLNSLGKSFTFSVEGNDNYYISIVIIGTRSNGSVYQEENNTGNYVTITIADDFTTISDIQLRVLRTTEPYTNTTSVIRNPQLEEGTVASEYKEYNGKDGWYYVDGVSTQETRSGKNKLYWTRPTFGTIVENEDGSFNWSYPYAQNLGMELTGQLKAGTYTITNYGDINLFIQKSTDDYTANTLKNGGTKTFTYDGTSYLRLLYAASTPDVSQLFKLQLEEGSTATEYEAYGVSPSPDYPSEIVNIYKAGTYDILIVNKVYTITLLEDLRGLPNGVGDRLWIDAVNNKSSIERKVGTLILDGSEDWTTQNISDTIQRFNLANDTLAFDDYRVLIMSNRFVGIRGIDHDLENDKEKTWIGGVVGATGFRITILKSRLSEVTVAGFKTWLSTHNTEVYYELETYKTEVYPVKDEYTSIGEFSWILDEYSKYEGYKNNTTLIDLAGNEFRTQDMITIEDNQVILIKNGVYVGITDENGNEIEVETEEIFLGNVVMPKTYTPITSIYCHQNILIEEVVYRDPRNIDVSKLNLENTILGANIETEYNFSQDDLTKAQDYALGKITLTKEELDYYDVNDDGLVNTGDVMQINRMMAGSIPNKITGTFEIDTTQVKRNIILRDDEGNILTAIGVNKIETPNIIADNLYFKNGETYTVERMHLGGFITSSAEQVTFTVPLPKRLDKIRAVTVLDGKMFARVVGGGYLNGADYNTPISYGDSGYTWSVAYFNENTVTITVTKSSDYTGVPNNSPLGIEIQDLKLEFDTGEAEQ